MLKKGLLLLIIVLCYNFSYAQYVSYGVMIGGSNYQGDLSPVEFRDFFPETRLAGGAFYSLNYNDFLSTKASLIWANVQGFDSHSTNLARKEKNLSFKSSIYEFAFTGELNIIGFNPSKLNRMVSPYLFGGVAGIYFEPKAFYKGEWIKLQPLGTEGQGMDGFSKKYSRFSISFPFGFGVKWAINENWNVGVELGSRLPLTDYIDDVSTDYVNYNELLIGNGELAANLGDRTGELYGSEPYLRPTGASRGNDKVTDWYFIGTFNVSYNLYNWPFKKRLFGHNQKKRNDLGCPTFK